LHARSVSYPQISGPTQTRSCQADYRLPIVEIMTLSNAYSAYLAAKNNGWDLVASFHARVGSTHAEIVARADNLSLDAARLLLRVHHRTKPGHLVASTLKLSLDHLKLVSTAMSKVDKKLNNPVKIRARMLHACANATVTDAAIHIRTILAECTRPEK